MHRPPARRPRRLAAVLSGVAVSAPLACGDDATEPPVVVAVAAQPCDRPSRDRGLGVVVADGLVATAAHTVDGDRRELTVDGRPAHVVAIDTRTDLAVLSATVDGTPAELSSAGLRQATVRTVDDELAVEVVRTGRLVVEDMATGERHEREVHTFSPGVAAGTSGAPLVDDAGRVAGIVVLVNRADGTAYAVTAAEVVALMEREPGSAAEIGCPG